MATPANKTQIRKVYIFTKSLKLSSLNHFFHKIISGNNTFNKFLFDKFPFDKFLFDKFPFDKFLLSDKFPFHKFLFDKLLLFDKFPLDKRKYEEIRRRRDTPKAAPLNNLIHLFFSKEKHRCCC